MSRTDETSLMTPGEVAQMLHVPLDTIYRVAQRRHRPARDEAREVPAFRS